MAEKKKEKSGAHAAPVNPNASLEELSLDRPEGKYSLVPLAAIWAKELKKQEEFRHLSTAQLLDAALKDALIGKVTWETVADLPDGGNGSFESKGEKKK